MPRFAPLLALSLALPALALSALAQQSRPPIPSAAQQLLALTNGDRAAQGLPPLAWSPELAAAAQAHAAQMAEHAAIEHQFPGEPDMAMRAAQAGEHFHAVAENVALGGAIPQLESEWIHSPEHRANILDPRMNAAGVGLVRRGSAIYAVEDFAAAIPSLSFGQIEARVAALLRAQGVPSVQSSQTARQTCEMTHGWAGGPQPLFLMRWEGSDLTRLPSALTQRLQQQHVRSAAVGACGSARPGQPFTSYRVAVLLY